MYKFFIVELGETAAYPLGGFTDYIWYFQTDKSSKKIQKQK